MLKNINKVIRIMVLSDLFLYSGWGLITPILAIYIVGNIQGGDAKIAGIAIGIYWITKSIIQIPLAYYLDKIHGEYDDYYCLLAGIFISSLTPIGFVFSTMPWHIYLLEAVHGLGMAMVFPSWAGIFTRHIEKKREAICWGLDSSLVNIGTGVGGIIGGILAVSFGFTSLFIAVSLLGIVSFFALLFIRKTILPTEKTYLIPKP